MKKTVLKFGLFSAAAIIGLFAISFFLMQNLSFAVQEVWGYLSVFVALSFTFFGIKAYRDEHLDGKIGFGRALGTGLLITLFPAIAFGLFDAIYVSYINPEFFEQYYAQAVAEMSNQYAGDELAAKLAEMESTKDLASSVFFNFILMFFTVFVVGFIVSLISAVTLRRL